MAFTHDRDTDLGRIRTLIYDSVSTDYLFEDSDITAMLDVNESDLWRTAADLCRSAAAKYSKEALKIGLGKKDIDLDLTKRAAFYSELAISFDHKSNAGNMSEYIDSVNYSIGGFGQDNSEYVGD